MTLSQTATVFAIMMVLALIPGVSVFTVLARTAAGGLRHGLATTVGIVVGDMIFITIVLFGLSLLAELTHLVRIVQYVGGIYLIGLGIALWWAKPKPPQTDTHTVTSWLSSFLAGLLITLGDQKAILFYLGFFPAFCDLATLTPRDTGLLIASAITAIGIAKLSYALLIDKAKSFFDNPKATQTINRTASLLMVGAGVYVVAKDIWEHM